jgi:hypothetical protein
MTFTLIAMMKNQYLGTVQSAARGRVLSSCCHAMDVTGCFMGTALELRSTIKLIEVGSVTAVCVRIRLRFFTQRIRTRNPNLQRR